SGEISSVIAGEILFEQLTKWPTVPSSSRMSYMELTAKNIVPQRNFCVVLLGEHKVSILRNDPKQRCPAISNSSFHKSVQLLFYIVDYVADIAIQRFSYPPQYFHVHR